MFKRSFMESFKITKYARQSGHLGRISSNQSILFKGDLYRGRPLLFVFITFMVVQATENFQFFYEIFVHYKQPYNKTIWENKVPDEVKIPNQQIIENWKKIHQMRELQSTFM